MSKIAETYGTLQYFKKYTWKNIRKRTINASPIWSSRNQSYLNKKIELRMSRQEYNTFCDKYSELIENLYAKGDVPSIDRVDADGHYEVSNLQIIPHKQNKPYRKLLD